MRILIQEIQMSYPYEPRLAMTKKWGLSWEEVYYYELVELEKEPSLVHM